METTTTEAHETTGTPLLFSGELLTLREAAKMLKVSRKTLYKWQYSGKLRTLKIAGSLVRIPRSDIDALIRTARETN